MSSIPTMEEVASQVVQTDRLKMHVLTAGPGDGTPVIFIHGNGSSATFWEGTMRALPEDFHGIAPAMRGYGDTEPLPIDATLGLSDMVEDVHSLVDSMGLGKHHIVGHSMGGGIVMKVAIAYPEDLLSITLVDTMSPYGYSGSKGVEGTPCHEDGAPAGAAGVNPDFIKLLAAKERGAEDPMAPRNVLRQFYVKPPFVPEREDALVESMLSLKIGDDWYPGDSVPSEHWPGAAPGERGVVNAFSRKYFDASGIVDIEPRPSILWIRGADDLVVSNNAMWDIAALGAMEFVPGWPGPEDCPPQPMLDQIRAVLEVYEANGGSYREEVIGDAGHSPFIEKPGEFNALFHAFLKKQAHREGQQMTNGASANDFQVGDRASFSKTVSEEDVNTFAELIGDFNPLHVDEEYARESRFGGRIAHGVFTAGVISAVLGNELPGPGGIYLSQQIDFLAPVYLGDTITAVVEVISWRPDKRIITLKTDVYNQDEKQVATGEAVLLVERVEA